MKCSPSLGSRQTPLEEGLAKLFLPLISVKAQELEMDRTGAREEKCEIWEFNFQKSKDLVRERQHLPMWASLGPMLHPSKSRGRVNRSASPLFPVKMLAFAVEMTTEGRKPSLGPTTCQQVYSGPGTAKTSGPSVTQGMTLLHIPAADFPAKENTRTSRETWKPEGQRTRILPRTAIGTNDSQRINDNLN